MGTEVPNCAFVFLMQPATIRFPQNCNPPSTEAKKSPSKIMHLYDSAKKIFNVPYPASIFAALVTSSLSSCSYQDEERANPRNLTKCLFSPFRLNAFFICPLHLFFHFLLYPFSSLSSCQTANSLMSRMASSGTLRRVALVRSDVSEEPSASFIRVTRIGKLGTTLAATSNRHTLRRNWYFFAACVGC
jgi:hypothetical protein